MIDKMQDLPMELINIIKSSLDRLSLHYFSHTCKILFDNYDTYIMNKINARLEKIFGNDVSDLKKSMQMLGCVISGSFVLQCMLDEEWKGSDIDFYVPICGDVIRPGCHRNSLDAFMCATMNFFGRTDCGYDDSNQDKIKWVRTFDNMRTTRNKLRTSVDNLLILLDMIAMLVNLKVHPQIFMMVDLTGIIIVAVVISVHSAEKSQIFLALTSIIVIILAAIFTLIHK